MKLFSSFKVGNITLPNRLVMAPLTRGRAEEGGIPGPSIAQYYSMRSDAGLLITEATAISPQGFGWFGAPGIYTDEQEAGWAQVTAKVHAKGGRIALQLWHMGRVSHSDFQSGTLPVAPSAIAATGHTRTPTGKRPYEVPRELRAEELPGIANDYVVAAKRAIRAGFDLIEVHAANGYLLDQFLRNGANHRTDEFGGTIENRVRFPEMVVRGLVEAIGADKVGVRISPKNAYNDMSDTDPAALFELFAKRMDALGIAYLHVMEPGEGHMMYVPGPPVHPLLRAAFSGPLMLNGGLSDEKGEQVLSKGEADLIALGVPFIANPDLVRRYKEKLPLNRPDVATFYTQGEKGYLDYPTV